MEKCLLKRPTKISFRNSIDANNGNVSHRRRSNVQEDQNIVIEDLKLGEQFSMALSSRGIVYTWGQNDKGQLGHGNETNHSYHRQPRERTDSLFSFPFRVFRVCRGFTTKVFQAYPSLCKANQAMPSNSSKKGSVMS